MTEGDLEAGGNSPEARALELANAMPDDQEDALHLAYEALAKEHSLGPAQVRELQAMIGTLSDLTREGTSVGDLKIASAALGLQNTRSPTPLSAIPTRTTTESHSRRRRQVPDLGGRRGDRG